MRLPHMSYISLVDLGEGSGITTPPCLTILGLQPTNLFPDLIVESKFC